MQLVIAEKPSVAQSIAGVIGANERKDGYMEGNGYIVSWCVGHLVELAQPDAYFDTWKKWSYESLPMIPEQWKHEVKKDTAAQYRVLKELMHEAKVDSVVCATDAGREGELIFRLVYEMAGCNKSMKRLWISSMEESAIREGFAELKPGSDYDHLYESALCRQQADWLVGLNGTRLFTVLYGGKVLKVGRVQTPTLAMLVDRETKIMNFKKEAYYMAHIIGGGVDAVTDKINSKAEAENVANICAGGQALVTSVLKEEKSVAPPKLYDLTTLQRDANRLFGFTAKQTLEYTQSLYEKKLCTYPRTDSQYLSDDMEQTAKSVIDAIFAYILFEQNIIFHPDIKRVLNSKKVTDHHAIIPTMEITRADLTALPETEMKILSLCANRLLCATGEKHIYNTTKAELRCGDITFKVSGKEVVRNGWKDFEDAFKRSYKTTEEKDAADEKEKKLPELSEEMNIPVEETKVSEHFTAPPKHFTEDSLLSAMERAGAEDMGDDVERKGLGTPATRADIIEKLVKDGFVKREKKQMIPTEDGMKLITVLPDDENSKAAACVEKAFEIWEQTKEQKSTQLIFCDLSTPKGDGTFNVYEDIKKKLMEKGVPENEIAFIHDANTELRKAELFGKVRSGHVRFLLGSTQKMGAGTNVQDRLIALHHLDVPWRPSDVGRILRTFKIKKNVEVTDNGKIII